MTTLTLTTPPHLRGAVAIPGDKSISHRAVMFNAVAEGTAHITNFLTGADCLSTIACMQALGATIARQDNTVQVTGVGLSGLQEADDILDCGNSGTTLRLLTGLLAGQPSFAVLSGDTSLRARPQRRIVDPLRSFGAQIDGRTHGERAPLAIRGATFRGGSYDLPIASAQVKSALLLAALRGAGPLTLTGRIASRDHTERMLQAMGADLRVEADQLTLHPISVPLRPLSLRVPGDPSSAAFWWVAAAIHPDAEITTMGVGLNPTRTGMLDVLRSMGVHLEINNERLEGSEPVGDVTVWSSALRGVEIGGALIPRLIDEIPVLAVAAAQANGDTLIRDAQELRVKESDRITTVVAGLEALGVAARPTADGIAITGNAGQPFADATLHSHGDHRLAMAWAVAALAATSRTVIVDANAVAVSYPTFWQTLDMLSGKR